MKLALQLAQRKQQKQRKLAELKGGRNPGRKWRLRSWTVLALCLALAGAGTWAAFEFFIWTRLPAGLVGKWVVQGGPMSGGTFDFARNGILETRIKNGGTVYTLKAQVTVADKTILTTTRHPQTGEEDTRRSIIRELTANSLVVELEKGQRLTMVREK